MPSWEQFVRSRLGRLGLDPAREADVCEELSEHLEDLCEHWRERGADAQEAEQHACAHVSDWNRLGREIWLAKAGEDTMRSRIMNLWLPGLATGVLALGLLSGMYHAGVRPEIVGANSGSPLAVNVLWLAVLPLIGAIGAFWSRYAGGKPNVQRLAGVFPVAVLAGGFLVLLPIAILIEPQVSLAVMLKSLLVHTINWVVIPGAALLVGILLFQRFVPQNTSTARLRQ